MGKEPLDLLDETKIDPLRRAFIPREFAAADGRRVFCTQDGAGYIRDRDGSIRRAAPKVNGKAAKRERALARKREASQ